MKACCFGGGAEVVDAGVVGDDLLGQPQVGTQQRASGVVEGFGYQVAHVGETVGESVELLLVGVAHGGRVAVFDCGKPRQFGPRLRVTRLRGFEERIPSSPMDPTVRMAIGGAHSTGGVAASTGDRVAGLAADPNGCARGAGSMPDGHRLFTCRSPTFRRFQPPHPYGSSV